MRLLPNVHPIKASLMRWLARAVIGARWLLRLLLRALLRLAGLLRRQWLMLMTLAAALALTSVVAVVLVRDARPPTVSEDDIRGQGMGVYVDEPTRAALRYQVHPEAAALGVEAPEVTWNMTLRPGRRTHGQVTLIALGGEPGYWSLDISVPLRVVFSLPQGARLEEQEPRLRSGTPSSTCASWVADEEVRTAAARVERSITEQLVVTCALPAIGAVRDLFLEVHFSWPDDTYQSAGYARSVGAVRFETFPSWATDIEAPYEGDNDRFLLLPGEVQLRLPTGQRVTDSFPQPEGGGLGTRTWKIEQDRDIEYALESPQARLWVGPGTTLGLLAAGVLLGLLPVSRRRSSVRTEHRTLLEV